MRASLLPCLAAAAIVGAVAQPAAAQTATALPIDGTLLEVSATGRTTRVPDVAVIRAGVITQSTTAAAALAENATQMNKVLAALKRAGVAPRDIQTAQIGLAPQYRYQENVAPVITGYQATNSVSIRFRDIARSGTILDTLVREGANQIDGPNLTIDQPEAAADEARKAAVATARARAELYARAAGLSVSRILSISETGDYAPAPPMPMMMVRAESRAADSKIAAGEQEVAITVNVRFLLK